MQNFYKLANIMGLDSKNAQHTIALTEALNGILDIEDFLIYCRDNKNKISFETKVEKLDTIATKYKRERNGIDTNLLESFSAKIARKFKDAISPLREHEEHLTGNIGKLTVAGKQFFTDKEILLLNSVGSLNSLIGLHEIGTLQDALYAVSIKKTNASKAIDNKVMKQIKGVAK